MVTFIIGIILTIAVLLILVVLMQNSKGGGMSSQFGSAGSQIMGAQRTTDILEKLTWGFAISMLFLALITNVLVDKTGGQQQFVSPNEEAARQNVVAPTSTDTSNVLQQPVTPTDTSKK